MLAEKGTPAAADIAAVWPSPERLRQGPVAVFECFQRMPGSPGAGAGPRGAVRPCADSNDCPVVDESKCNGCGACLSHCPGLSIMVVDLTYSPQRALLKIPYEFAPLPEPGETVVALDRCGHAIGVAEVVRIQQNKNHTAVVWLTVAPEQITAVRSFRRHVKEGQP